MPCRVRVGRWSIYTCIYINVNTNDYSVGARSWIRLCCPAECEWGAGQYAHQSIVNTNAYRLNPTFCPLQPTVQHTRILAWLLARRLLRGGGACAGGGVRVKRVSRQLHVTALGRVRDLGCDYVCLLLSPDAIFNGKLIKAECSRMLWMARFVTVYLLSGPIFGVGLRKLPGERRFFKTDPDPGVAVCAAPAAITRSLRRRRAARRASSAAGRPS